jgi:1-acyl-sn-glycerol-3-phosphate acyltransferase
MFQHTILFMVGIATIGAVTTVLYTASYPFYFLLGLLGIWPGKTPRSSQIGSILHKFSGAWVLWMAGIKVFIGKDSQQKIAAFDKRNVVFVFNHTTNCDPFILTAALPANVRFVYKESLKYVPFLGCGLVTAGHISVDRGARDKAINSLHRAEAQLLKKPSEGGSFALAPEGTRSRDGKLITPFKKGPFHVAKNTSTVVVPVMVRGGHELFPPGSMRVVPGVVSVKCLEPIDSIKFKDADDLKDAVEKAMVEATNDSAWGAGDLPAEKKALLPVTANPIVAIILIAAIVAAGSLAFSFFLPKK